MGVTAYLVDGRYVARSHKGDGLSWTGGQEGASDGEGRRDRWLKGNKNLTEKSTRGEGTSERHERQGKRREMDKGCGPSPSHRLSWPVPSPNYSFCIRAIMCIFASVTLNGM
jgi:hypothetical protein